MTEIDDSYKILKYGLCSYCNKLLENKHIECEWIEKLSIIMEDGIQDIVTKLDSLKDKDGRN